MAKPDDKNLSVYQFVYVGPHQCVGAEQLKPGPDSPSPDFARTIALGILNGSLGCYRASTHCRERIEEREFDVFDVEYVIRNGQCVGLGKYSSEHKDHTYVFRGDIDGTKFDAVFSLSAEHDFIKSPLMTLISGCWKTKSGKRGRRY